MTTHRLQALLALLTAGLCAVGADAAEGKVTAEFAFGYSGIVPDRRRLIPVAVTLNNQREDDLSGEIRVTRPGTAAGAEVTQAVPFESPRSSRRRFNLLTRVEPGRDLRVRVVFDQKVPSQSKIWSAQTAQEIILAVGLPTDYRKARNKNQTPFSRHYTLVRSRRGDLPERLLAWDGVFAVALSGKALMDLRGDRKRFDLLRQWVRHGGRLLVVNPVRSPSYDQAISAFNPGFAQARDDALVHAHVGCGQVVVNAPTRENPFPFWTYDRYEQTTAQVFPALYGRSELMADGNAGTEGVFGTLVDIQTNYSLLGFVWLLLIIGGYILFIGPLDYLLLKRLRRPWLNWAFFLLAIAAFSVVAWWYSGVVHASDRASVQINVVDCVAGDDTARGHSWFWIYSVKNAEYTVSSPSQPVHFSAREGVAFSSAARVRVENRGATPNITARIPVFSAKTFDAAWIQPPPWAVEYNADAVEDEPTAVLPADLPVRAIALADDRGVHPLAYDVDTGHCRKRKERPTSWGLFLDRASRAHGNGREPPEIAELQKYLEFISFCGRGESQALDQTALLASQLNTQERALNLTANIGRGEKVLLVFLEPRPALLPLGGNGVEKRSPCLNLVRYRIPPAD